VRTIFDKRVVLGRTTRTTISQRPHPQPHTNTHTVSGMGGTEGAEGTEGPTYLPTYMDRSYIYICPSWLSLTFGK